MLSISKNNTNRYFKNIIDIVILRNNNLGVKEPLESLLRLAGLINQARNFFASIN